MTTDTKPEAAQAAPVRMIDVLPVRGGKRIALDWFPHHEDYEHGEGFLVLTGDRDRTRYSVVQAHSSGPLLCFVFTKFGGDKGTDAGKEAYVLTCCPSGAEPHCECRSYSKNGYCKHADALETLFLNKWL